MDSPLVSQVCTHQDSLLGSHLVNHLRNPLDNQVGSLRVSLLGSRQASLLANLVGSRLLNRQVFQVDSPQFGLP